MTTRELLVQPNERAGYSYGAMLAELKPSDAEQYYALIADDREHLRSFGNETLMSYVSSEQVRSTIDHYVQPRDGILPESHFGIWPGSTMVGSLGYYAVAPKVVIMSLWIGKRYAGQGYGTAAIGEASARLIAEGYQRIRARIHKTNLASQRAFERNSFRRVGGNAEDFWYIHTS